MEIEDCLAVIGRDAAWRWIVERFIPGGPECPSCGAGIRGEKALASFFGLRRTWCKECEHVFTPTVGSPISETSWQPEEFLKLLVLSLVGRSPAEIAQHLNKSPATIKGMLAKVARLSATGCITWPAGSIEGDKKGARGEGGGENNTDSVPLSSLKAREFTRNVSR